VLAQKSIIRKQAERPVSGISGDDGDGGRKVGQSGCVWERVDGGERGGPGWRRRGV